MKKVSIFKKIKFYFQYRKIILKNKEEFQNSFNLRIDRVNRIYTVINIPNELFEEPYNLRTSDINKISEPYITEYLRQISDTLNKKGLGELFALYSMSKVDKYSYLIVIGFSLFNTDKAARNIFLRFIPAAITISAISFLIFKLL
jgi:hypothetical protein